MKLQIIATLVAPLLLLSPNMLAQQSDQPPTEREKELLEKINALEERVKALENKTAESTNADAEAAASTTGGGIDKTNAWLKDTTLNFFFDGYYDWNTNRPVGRVNLLRAYDVTANNFSINQTGIVVERAPDLKAGRRWGFRLDLMYGQATQTLQGSAQNEPRPQVYRNVYQAYGTYVVPIGKGLRVDFGKWASSLGGEGNYTKDQMNYSRSYFFLFLPFYHMGLRSTYAINDKISVGYWLVNGANQTEDFNNFKSQLGQAIITPTKKVTWTINYYNGQEQRDVVPILNPGLPSIASQPGLSTTPVTPVPRGRFHVIDTYAFWDATDKVTVGAEFAWVLNRVQTNSAPQRVMGGAAYFRYQLTSKLYFAQRYTRLNDYGGLFSGITQNLNAVTSTVGFRPAEGFEAKLEYRRDFSNTPFFLTSVPGSFSKHQDTFTLGLLWWFGGKSGSW